MNVSGEAHNFHIHQSEFYVLPQSALPRDAGKLMDNVSLPNGGATCDGAVAARKPARSLVTSEATPQTRSGANGVLWPAERHIGTPCCFACLHSKARGTRALLQVFLLVLGGCRFLSNE